MLQNRARNLFVVASGICVFLLAGADVEQLAFGAIKTPARYPEVVRVASVLMLLWFWWRYSISWLDLRERYERDYLRALHGSARFQRWIIQRLQEDHSEFLHERFTDTGQEERISGKIMQVDEGEPTRFRFKVTNVSFFDSPNSGISVQAGPDAPEIRVPVLTHFAMSTVFRVWRALRREDFADTVLPHIVATVAAALVFVAWLGVDPAGVFGWLDG